MFTVAKSAGFDNPWATSPTRWTAPRPRPSRSFRRTSSPSCARGVGGESRPVVGPLQQGRRCGDEAAVRQVPGPALEDWISGVIRCIAPASAADPLALPVRVEVHAESLQLLMPVTLLATLRSRLVPSETAEPDAADPVIRLIFPVRMCLHRRAELDTRQHKPRIATEPVLIKALRAAHAMRGAHHAGLSVLEAAPPSPYLRRLGKNRLSCTRVATRHP